MDQGVVELEGGHRRELRLDRAREVAAGPLCLEALEDLEVDARCGVDARLCLGQRECGVGRRGRGLR